MMQQMLIIGIWVGMAALFGLIIGSFLNVCVYRLPVGITIVHGHSFCPKCKHTLSNLDLIPVISYLMLGRRCRYCRQPISSRYASIEILSGVYFAVAALLWHPGRWRLPQWLIDLTGGPHLLYDTVELFQASFFLTLSAVLTFSGLLVWALIMWDEQQIPRGLYLFVLGPILLRLVLQPERLLGHVIALGLSLMIFYVLYQLGLFPESTDQHKQNLGFGLGLLGLMAGLTAVQPVLLVLLLELMFIIIYEGLRKRKGKNSSRQNRFIWRSLPLQCLLVASVTWLIF